MNKYKLKIKCFIHKKYNCCLHDLFSEQSMWSTTSTTTAPSPLKIGSLVQLNEVEFAVYPISFELITSKHSYHLYWNTFSAVISKFFGKIGIVMQHFSWVKYSASRANPWQQQYTYMAIGNFFFIKIGHCNWQLVNKQKKIQNKTNAKKKKKVVNKIKRKEQALYHWTHICPADKIGFFCLCVPLRSEFRVVMSATISHKHYARFLFTSSFYRRGHVLFTLYVFVYA